MVFHNPKEECEKYIEHLRKSEGKHATSHLKTHSPNWREWRFEVGIRGGGCVTLNALHVAIIMRNIEVVNHILDQEDNIKSYVDQEVKESVYHKHDDEEEDDDWIYGATVLHLAARFFHDCLQKLIEMSSSLVNNQDNRMKYSPLHVTAISEFSVGSRILLLKGAKVDAQEKHGRTPLYFAAKSENYHDVVTLVEEGGADIYKKDSKRQAQAPFNVAKSCDILKFFFSKMTAKELVQVDPDVKLFEEVVDNHPTLIEAFLNIFLTSKTKDLDDPKNKFQYDMSLFVRGNKEKRKNSNMMHRHLKLIDSENTQMLLHPIMRAFSDLKWLQFFWIFFGVIMAVFFFLVSFTWHEFMYVDFVQCKPLNETQIESHCAEGFMGLVICTNQDAFDEFQELNSSKNALLCKDELRICRKKSWRSGNSSSDNLSGAYDDPDSFQNILNCFSKAMEEEDFDEKLKNKIKINLDKLDRRKSFIWVSWSILIAIEIAQFWGKIYKNRIKSYFTLQNVIEVGVLIGTACYQWYSPSDIEKAGHIGGWTIFFGWMSFTVYLCQISSFGRAIYSSIHVTKKIMKALVIFIPSLVGFTAAFHFFLHGNEHFHDFLRSFLKVIVMMIGEYDFEDNFSYTKVQDFGGRGVSLQLMFVLFTIYGSVIVMNLLVALMVNQMNMEEAEALLQTHRVEEISDKIEVSTILKTLKKCFYLDCNDRSTVEEVNNVDNERNQRSEMTSMIESANGTSVGPAQPLESVLVS